MAITTDPILLCRFKDLCLRCEEFGREYIELTSGNCCEEQGTLWVESTWSCPVEIAA
jgi:hypothetical protein